MPLFLSVPVAVDAEAGCLVLPRVAGTPLLDVPRTARAVCTALEDLAFGLETGRDNYRTNALAALEELT